MKFRLSLYIALVFAGIASISSCSKSYTCHCDFKYSGAPGLPDSSSTNYTITGSKSAASSECTKETGTYNNNNISTTENCFLY